MKLQNTSLKAIIWTRPRSECGACQIQPKGVTASAVGVLSGVRMLNVIICAVTGLLGRSKDAVRPATDHDGPVGGGRGRSKLYSFFSLGARWE